MGTKINKVRYNFISRKVFEIQSKFGICSYPIDLDNIINFLDRLGINVEVDTYSGYAKFINKSVSYVKTHIFKSNDGATAYLPAANLYIIFYNDKKFTRGRINWTKAHEIGHIILDHYIIMSPLILQRRRKSDKQYEILEKEADWFAKLFICHPEVLQKCGFKNVKQIMTACGVSESAAKNRLEEISRPLKLFNQYDTFISNLFYNFIYKKYCNRCGYNFIIKDAKHCPICGKENLKWGGNKKMIYSEVKVDKNSKALQCPRCNNESILEGEYCKICGIKLVNKCHGADQEDWNGNMYFQGGCEDLADGNARYCHKCGAETTFGYFKILKSWNEEQKEIRSLAKLKSEFKIADASDEIEAQTKTSSPVAITL